MKWTKLKALIESRFSSTLKKRVAIHSTRYGNCNCGHAWLTLDGTIVANFCTRAHMNRIDFSDRMSMRAVTEKEETRYKTQFVEYGELSRNDVYLACWTFIHHLAIEEALCSDNPIIQTLAVLDSRVGKRRLRKLQKLQSLHPLARHILAIRTETEFTSLLPTEHI